MRTPLPAALTFFVVLTVQETVAQDAPLYRSERPIALKLGFFSLGADLSVGELVAIDVNTLWIFAYDYKVRIFLLRRNSTPYVGLGGLRRFLIERTEDKFIFHAGWQYDNDAAILQLGVLIASKGDIGLTKKSLYPVFAFGIRFSLSN